MDRDKLRPEVERIVEEERQKPDNNDNKNQSQRNEPNHESCPVCGDDVDNLQQHLAANEKCFRGTLLSMLSDQTDMLAEISHTLESISEKLN